MSITLSSADLEKLAHAVQLLVSPLDHESVDHWRSAVNRHLRQLLCADTAGFLLPVETGLAMYSDEHDPRALAPFNEFQPPLLADGRTVWEEGVRAGVTTVKRAYGPAFDRFLRSAYYNDYAAANRAHDTIGATIPVGSVAPDAVASLHFWHERPVGRLFGERELALLRLLFPAFRAGVEAQVRWGNERANLLSGLDALEQAVVVFDRAGTRLHQTCAATAMLEADPEGATLDLEMHATMRAIRSAAASASDFITGAVACARKVQTSSARYAVRGCVYGGPLRGSGTYLLVSLERLSPNRRQATDLQKAFGLTKAELRVAALLADGRTNAEIARQLGVTEHTTRRHTERILQKMGIHSRAQVAVWMYS